jgi:hypothetical protein
MQVHDRESATSPQAIRESSFGATLAEPRVASATAARRQILDLAKAHREPVATIIQTDPLIARTARLSLIAADFGRTEESMQQILKRHHGYAAEMNLNAEPSSARTLNASLRTPTGELDATIAELKGIGRVVQESRSGEDVTQQSVDLDARLSNARHREQVLTNLLEHRTAKISDVLEVEEQISATRGQIEQMEAERKMLDKRVDYARIDLQISEVFRAQLGPDPIGTRLFNAAVQGVQAMRDSLIGVTALILSGGPVILFWSATLLGPAWYLWRRFRKRRPPAN